MAGAGIFQGGLLLRPPVADPMYQLNLNSTTKGLMLRTQLCSKIAAKYNAPAQPNSSQCLTVTPFTVAGSQAKRNYNKER